MQIDVAVQQIGAIKKFDEASTKLTRAAIFMGICQAVVGLIAVAIALCK